MNPGLAKAMRTMRHQILCAAAVVAATIMTAPVGAQWDEQASDASFSHVDYHDAASLRARARELEARNAELEAVLAGGEGGCGCCLQPAGWFDPCCCGPTWAFSLNGDGWSDHGDFGLENNFGNRFTLDATWDLGGNGVRGHLGAAYGIYDYHGRIISSGFRDNTASAEQQIFVTAGLYRRGSGCCGDDWTWAIAYDYLNDNNYDLFGDNIEAHQFRFLLGRLVNPCNEFGVWGAIGIDDDDLSYDGIVPGTVEAQDQAHLYWRRYYDFGGETMLYAGLTSHNAALNTFPNLTGLDTNDDLTEAVIGLRGIAPLTCNIGLVGGFHYLIPSASGGQFGEFNERVAAFEESWNVTFGLVWVRGCSLPALPTADNGWMTKRITADFSQSVP